MIIFLHSPLYASAKITAMITEETNIKVNIETDLTCMPTDQITGFGNAKKSTGTLLRIYDL